jgi:hypothetical protein
MRVSFQTAKRIGVAIFGLKYNGADGGFYKSALAWDAELGGEV